MRDGEKKNENIKMMLNGRQLLLGLGTLGALAVLLAVGLAPDEAAAPGPEPSVAQVDSAAGVTLAADPPPAPAGGAGGQGQGRGGSCL